MKLMIVVGSVRPGRIGLHVAEWVRKAAEADGRFDVDFADLAEINLPFMDEPAHPRLRQYTKPHTIAWSERVDAADGFIFVTPEYNHSFSPALKNALDFLSQEWWRKPLGLVSYGGISAGTRGVTALESAVVGLGLVKAGAAVEISFPGNNLVDGEFQPTEKLSAILAKEFDELVGLSTALAPLQ